MFSVFVSGVILLTVTTCGHCQCRRYYDFSDIETTGASVWTARQDDLKITGVVASEKMASTDAGRMQKYKSIIIQVGGEKLVDPAIIAAIISRETRAGNTLDKKGFGKDRGFGLMQIDGRDGYKRKNNEPYSLGHVREATEILLTKINEVRKRHPDWTEAQVLKGGISAYNFGASNVQTLKGMDKGTTGGDYANDVVARAGWYRNNGYVLPRREGL